MLLKRFFLFFKYPIVEAYKRAKYVYPFIKLNLFLQPAEASETRIQLPGLEEEVD